MKNASSSAFPRPEGIALASRGATNSPFTWRRLLLSGRDWNHGRNRQVFMENAKNNENSGGSPATGSWRPPWYVKSRSKNARAYEIWSVAEEEQLKQEYSRGLTLKKIAWRHGRSKIAVSLRLLNLGLVGDFSIIKKCGSLLAARQE